MAKKLNVYLGQIDSANTEEAVEKLTKVIDASMEDFENELGIKISSFSVNNKPAKTDGAEELHVNMTVNSDVEKTTGTAMGSEKYDKKDIIKLVKSMLNKLAKDSKILESTEITESDTMSSNELMGNVNYKYEISVDKMKPEDYSGGAEAFRDSLSEAIQTHIETMDKEIEEAVGSSIYCQSVEVSSVDAKVDLQINDPDAVRKTLSQEIEVQPEQIDNEELLLFVGSVIADVEDDDLKIAVVQIPDGDEDVQNYFVFKDEVGADDLVIESGNIRLDAMTSMVVKATE